MIQIKAKSNCFMVQNRFVDEYMCEANGSFIKVYLYMLRHGESGFEMSDIANALNLLESDVIRAFKYWQKRGLITYNQISDGDFIISLSDEGATNVQTNDNDEPVTSKQPKRPSMPTAVTYKKSDIVTYMKNNDGIRHMFLISEQLLNRNLTDTDRTILFGFYDYLGMPIEVIFTLLEYCISLGKTNMRYIEKVAYTWADKGINTLAKASVAVKEETEFSKVLKKFKTMFKITGREFTNAEVEFIRSWVYEQKLDDKTIENAYETTVTNTGKIAFKYMDAILKNQNSQNKNTEYKPKTKETPRKKNAFQDYDDEITDFDIQLINNRLKRG